MDTMTFADVIAGSDVAPVTFVDDETPRGCFGAVTKVLGISTTYWLAGEKDDPAAVIYGRAESTSRSRTIWWYLGDRLKGGTISSRAGVHARGAALGGAR